MTIRSRSRSRLPKIKTLPTTRQIPGATPHPGKKRIWIRRSKQLFGYGVLGVGFGLAAYLPELSEQLPYHNAVHLAGGILSAASALAMAFAAAIQLCLHSARVARNVWDAFLQWKGVTPTYESRILAAEDLQQISAFGNEAAGSTFASPGVLGERHSRYAKLMKGVQDTTTSELIGCHLGYPLTKAACDEILTGRITTSCQIKSLHISPRLDRAHGLYVSLVFAKGSLARVFTMWSVKRDIETAIRMNPSIQLLFARPTSERGQQLLELFGFKPLSIGDTQIWARAAN